MAGMIGGRSMINNAATLDNFEQYVQQYDILHLAMHGIIDRDNPLNSRLVFSTNSSKQPYLLTPATIYGQQLNNGLAVLSACNSGIGKLEATEGIMSLARAFTFAGCRSLVMSLWSLDDKSTAKIMKNFYANLKAGKPKDVALQQAKLSYLSSSNLDLDHYAPFYWGAFVAIGNMDAIVDNNAGSCGQFIWGILALALSIGLFWFWRKRKRSVVK